ncbi:MAG: transporter substrate-binding protein [Deltaproteobacteria bacterium]|nr:transporter substrate-binding protein [Deltaproteobacteria bacterium]
MKVNIGRLEFVSLATLLFTLLMTFVRLDIDAAEKPIADRTVAELIEGAKKEGRLVVWDTTRGRGKEHFRAFEKKYPFIKVEQALVHSDEVVQKITMEQRAGRAPTADVIACNSVSYEQGKLDGVFASFPWRKVFKDIPAQAVDKDNFGVGAYGNIWTMAYNTKLVAKDKLPKSYDDLLNPEWRGKLAVDIRVNPWSYIVSSGVWTLEKAEAYVKRIKDNQPKFGRGGTAIAQLLTAGDFHIAPVYLFNIIEARKTGAPIDWIPMEPIGGNIAGRAIPKGAARMNAAVLYIAWLVTPEGQKVYEDTEGRSLPYEGLGTEMSRMLIGKKLAVVGWGDTEKALKHDDIEDKLMTLIGSKK